VREKEKEKEKARAEAAGRRQERAGRRRVDDDIGDETPKQSNSAKTSPPPSSQPGSPRASNAPDKVPPKKGPGKKMKKLGNNQYTNKSRDTAASSPHGRKRNGAGASSGEENITNGETAHLPNGAGKGSPEHSVGPKGKFGKGKNKAVNGVKLEDPADLTVAAMKRRMELMAAFISKAQMETAGGDKTPLGSVGTGNGEVGFAVQPPTPVVEKGDPASVGGGNGALESENGKKFEEMSAMEMADVVSRSINGWHQRFDHLV
jgi:hypothetical protein